MRLKVQPAEAEQPQVVRQYLRYFRPNQAPHWVNDDVNIYVDEPDRTVQTETVWIFPDSTVLNTASNG